MAHIRQPVINTITYCAFVDELGLIKQAQLDKESFDLKTIPGVSNVVGKLTKRNLKLVAPSRWKNKAIEDGKKVIVGNAGRNRLLPGNVRYEAAPSIVESMANRFRKFKGTAPRDEFGLANTLGAGRANMPNTAATVRGGSRLSQRAYTPVANKPIGKVTTAISPEMHMALRQAA